METVLILHGWGSRAENWSKVKELLENRGYNVLAPDLPGFGKNPPPQQPWATDDYLEWVKDFCAKQNLSQFFLMGHSFGGGLAVKFADRFPEKLKGLILVAPKIRRQKNYRYYLGLISAKLGKIIFSLPIFSFLRPLARRVLYAVIGTRDYYKLELAKTITMKETFRNVVSEELIRCLPRIKTPALIVWGKKDDMTPIKDAHLINKMIKGSKLEVIERGEHALNLQFPEVLAQKIINFIND